MIPSWYNSIFLLVSLECTEQWALLMLLCERSSLKPQTSLTWKHHESLHQTQPLYVHFLSMLLGITQYQYTRRSPQAFPLWICISNTGRGKGQQTRLMAHTTQRLTGATYSVLSESCILRGSCVWGSTGILTVCVLVLFLLSFLQDQRITVWSCKWSCYVLLQLSVHMLYYNAVQYRELAA